MNGLLWNSQTEGVLKLDFDHVPPREVVNITGVAYNTVHAVLSRYRTKYFIFRHGINIVPSIKEEYASTSGTNLYDIVRKYKTYDTVIRCIVDDPFKTAKYIKDIIHSGKHTAATVKQITFTYTCGFCNQKSKQTNFDKVVCPNCKRSHSANSYQKQDNS